MPEHVHLLLGEPEGGDLSVALQVLKQESSCKLKGMEGQFWQRRYYDFHVRTEVKRVEKLRYMHRNPVTRGLVIAPELWDWSSYRHYLSGEVGVGGGYFAVEFGWRRGLMWAFVWMVRC